MYTKWFILIYIVLKIDVGSSQLDCTADQQFRKWWKAEGKSAEPHSATTTVILMDTGAGRNNVPPEGNEGTTLTCCGTVDRWYADFRSGTPSENIFQIWRPEGANTFFLVGEGAQIGGSGAYTVTPTSGTVHVQVGDKMGLTGNNIEWDSSNNYNPDLLGHVLARDFGVDTPTPGDRYTLTAEHTECADNTQAQPHMVGFAFEMYVKPRADPECTITLPTTDIQEDTPIGTSIGKVATSLMVDLYIPGYDFSLTNTDGLSLVVDKTTGDITTTANFSVTPPFKSHTIKARTTEQVCLKFGECDATFRILFVNQPITLPDLPKDSNLIESTDKVTKIGTFDTSDLNRNTGLDNTPNCIIKSTVPAGAPVTIAKNIIPTKFDLSYDNTRQLNYDVVKKYDITVLCGDNYGSTVTGVYTLNIDNNYPPNVTNSEDASGKICNIVDARVIKNTQTVLQLTVVDAEGDAIESSCRARDTFSPFAWDKAGLRIYATQDLLAVEQEEFNFFVKIWDKWNRINSYFLCVQLVGRNSRPVFNNCPQNIQISEDKTAGDPVFRPLFTDANYARDNQKGVYSMTYSQNVYADTFNMDTASGQITVSGTGKGIDYEDFVTTLNGDCIKLMASVTDGIHPALLKCEMCIYITDVNEKPVLTPTTFTVPMKEEIQAPYLLSTVVFTLTDPDAVDTNLHVFSIIPSSNPGNYFSIDDKTGAVTLEQTCDLEASCPSTFNLVVNVEDPRGLTADATITVNIADINDNIPDIQPKSAQITVSPDTSTNQVLATFTTTDPDKGLNGDFTYAVSGMGLGFDYFRIVQTGNVGKLYLKKALPFTSTLPFQVTVEAKDKGSPSNLVGYSNIDVNYFVPTTSAPDEYRDPLPLLSSGRGVAITAALCLAGFAICCFIGYVSYINIFKSKFMRMREDMARHRKPAQGRGWKSLQREQRVKRVTNTFRNSHDTYGEMDDTILSTYGLKENIQMKDLAHQERARHAQTIQDKPLPPSGNWEVGY